MVERGLTFIPPYDHLDVITGQGTCGLEILEDWPEVGTLVVPVGGGGLLAGICAAVQAFRPDVRVVAVEPQRGSEALRRKDGRAPRRPRRWHESGRRIVDSLGGHAHLADHRTRPFVRWPP